MKMCNTTTSYLSWSRRKRSLIQLRTCAACGWSTSTRNACGCWAICSCASIRWVTFSTHGFVITPVILSTATDCRRRLRSRLRLSILRTIDLIWNELDSVIDEWRFTLKRADSLLVDSIYSYSFLMWGCFGEVYAGLLGMVLVIELIRL